MRMKKCNSKDVKARSQAITKLFESFTNKYDYLVGTVQRVYVNDKEDRKGVSQIVGHTKNYVKVPLPYDLSLLGKQIIVKVLEAKTWHVEAEIVDLNPPYE